MSVENLNNFENQKSEIPESEKGMPTLEPLKNKTLEVSKVNREDIDKAIKRAKGELGEFYKDEGPNKGPTPDLEASRVNTKELKRAVESLNPPKRQSFWQKLGGVFKGR